MASNLEPKRKDTRKHISAVREYMGEIIDNLEARSLRHDSSKLNEPEVSGFWEMQQRTPLSQMEYDSPEYRAALAENQATLRHHYEHNDHHPEHHTFGIQDMNLLQLLEMLADWKAATERMENGSLLGSIQKNKERFKYPAGMEGMLISTALELGWIKAEAD